MNVLDRFPARPRLALVLVRCAVALTMVIHGIARTAAGGVMPFGGWLSELGFPAGVAVAATITAVEVLGGLTLASGRLVRPLCLWFLCEHAMGIALVHAPNGWFVVGLGRNGMEYSVVLVVGFLATAVGHVPAGSVKTS
jgi:putative oxidoreductase